jgi:hypothetical protein
MKDKWISYSQLGPIPKVSHYVYAYIPQSNDIQDTSGPKHFE